MFNVTLFVYFDKNGKYLCISQLFYRARKNIKSKTLMLDMQYERSAYLWKTKAEFYTYKNG